MFHLPGHRVDKFWIAARDGAWRAFADVPAYFFARIPDPDLWEALSCHARTEYDDWLRQHWFSARGCEFCILRIPRYCPEVIVPYAFIRGGLSLRDACGVTGASVKSETQIPNPHTPLSK